MKRLADLLHETVTVSYMFTRSKARLYSRDLEQQLLSDGIADDSGYRVLTYASDIKCENNEWGFDLKISEETDKADFVLWFQHWWDCVRPGGGISAKELALGQVAYRARVFGVAGTAI